MLHFILYLSISLILIFVFLQVSWNLGTVPDTTLQKVAAEVDKEKDAQQPFH